MKKIKKTAKRSSSLDTKHQSVLDEYNRLVKTKTPITFSTMAENLGRPAQSVYWACKKLAAQGFLSMPDNASPQAKKKAANKKAAATKPKSTRILLTNQKRAKDNGVYEVNEVRTKNDPMVTTKNAMGEAIVALESKLGALRTTYEILFGG